MTSDVAGFPALARAKRLFLERKRVSGRQQLRSHGVPEDQAVARRPGSGDSRTRPTTPGIFQSTRALNCSALLVTLCSDLDEQLRQIGNDVLVGSASMRREYQREVHALDELTTALLDGHIDGSRASRQAVNAQILQTHFRSYLYWNVYPGGSDQLRAAAQLAKRCSQARALRHWRRMVQQRRKLRERRDRIRQRLTRTAGSWARAKAQSVVESEGKYAVAKEFQQAKLLVRCFQAWLG
ncbi:hypothetical protein BBJ28_00016362 [Nothophytophthora sp. Chile5]|nr:hypothetical protein BBJ28_00016362 [Nothophytophthora sp. Chile5]